MMRECLNDAKRISRLAGKEVMKIYSHQIVSKSIKNDSSFITIADITSEEIICRELEKYGHSILSEERGFRCGKREFLWIVDPLDGTNDFIDKTGDFSIMIALVEKEDPVLGVVYKPVDDKMYFACRGMGSFLEKSKKIKKLGVSNVFSLSKSTLVASRSHFSDTEKNLEGNKIVKKLLKVGSVGIKLGLISEGKAEIYINSSDKTGKWDIAAPQAILEEAGGIVTDTKGEKIKYNENEKMNLNGILATNNKENHNLILKYIKNL